MSATPFHRGGGWEGGFFTLSELTYSATATAHSIPNVPTAEVVKNLETLVHCVLDPVREAWGAPIIVSSGYRCKELNKRVGGAEHSYHLRGMAADIYPKNGCTEKLYRLIEHLFCQRKIGITECYMDAKRGYIHIAHNCEEFNEWPFLPPNSYLLTPTSYLLTPNS